MSRLPITIATWDYDRVRALTDGRVRVEGCDVNYITMPVEECFERAFFHGEFEVAEIGFSPHLIALSRGRAPYVAIPVFLSRMFRHSAVYIRTDRGIESPADLRGKRIGVPEYQMSAVMWFRGHLQDEYGMAAKDIHWVQAGLENPGPPRQVSAQPSGRFSTCLRHDASLSRMLADGEFDAVMSARQPSCFVNGHPQVGGYFPTIGRRNANITEIGHLSDYARARNPARHSRKAPLARREPLQGIPSGEAHRRGRIRRNDRPEDRSALDHGRIRSDQ